MKQMNNKLSIVMGLFLALQFAFFANCNVQASQKQKPKLSALIVTGQNNHYWKNSTPIFKKILEDAKIFRVDIAQSPANGEDMSNFNPAFPDYDVVVLDYNGAMWNDATKKRFEKYVSGGGGVVVVHAADNSFAEWAAFNEIIGLGGWGGRDEKSGPYVYWKDGKTFRDYSAGPGGGHGAQREYLVTTRAPKHPIMKKMPSSWKHAQDELYCNMRGPAENMEILATSFSKSSKKEEPALFTIKYGKGRVFHTILGHVGKEQTIAVQCAGFVYSLQRGTEWAATGKVKQKLPKDLLNPKTVHLMPQYNIIVN
jgi:type 1 glutamine amidotransferase